MIGLQLLPIRVPPVRMPGSWIEDKYSFGASGNTTGGPSPCHQRASADPAGRQSPSAAKSRSAATSDLGYFPACLCSRWRTGPVPGQHPPGAVGTQIAARPFLATAAAAGATAGNGTAPHAPPARSVAGTLTSAGVE